MEADKSNGCTEYSNGKSSENATVVNRQCDTIDLVSNSTVDEEESKLCGELPESSYENLFEMTSKNPHCDTIIKISSKSVVAMETGQSFEKLAKCNANESPENAIRNNSQVGNLFDLYSKLSVSTGDGIFYPRYLNDSFMELVEPSRVSLQSLKNLNDDDSQWDLEKKVTSWLSEAKDVDAYSEYDVDMSSTATSNNESSELVNIIDDSQYESNLNFRPIFNRRNAFLNSYNGTSDENIFHFGTELSGRPNFMSHNSASEVMFDAKPDHRRPKTSINGYNSSRRGRYTEYNNSIHNATSENIFHLGPEPSGIPNFMGYNSAPEVMFDAKPEHRKPKTAKNGCNSSRRYMEYNNSIHNATSENIFNLGPEPSGRPNFMGYNSAPEVMFDAKPDHRKPKTAKNRCNSSRRGRYIEYNNSIRNATPENLFHFEPEHSGRSNLMSYNFTPEVMFDDHRNHRKLKASINGYKSSRGGHVEYNNLNHNATHDNIFYLEPKPNGTPNLMSYNSEPEKMLDARPDHQKQKTSVNGCDSNGRGRSMKCMNYETMFDLRSELVKGEELQGGYKGNHGNHFDLRSVLNSKKRSLDCEQTDLNPEGNPEFDLKPTNQGEMTSEESIVRKNESNRLLTPKYHDASDFDASNSSFTYNFPPRRTRKKRMRERVYMPMLASLDETAHEQTGTNPQCNPKFDLRHVLQFNQGDTTTEENFGQQRIMKESKRILMQKYHEDFEANTSGFKYNFPPRRTRKKNMRGRVYMPMLASLDENRIGGNQESVRNEEDAKIISFLKEMRLESDIRKDALKNKE